MDTDKYDARDGSDVDVTAYADETGNDATHVGHAYADYTSNRGMLTVMIMAMRS